MADSNGNAGCIQVLADLVCVNSRYDERNDPGFFSRVYFCRPKDPKVFNRLKSFCRTTSQVLLMCQDLVATNS